MLKNDIVKCVLVLLLISVIAVGALVYVNSITKDRIDEADETQAKEIRSAALGTLAEGAEEIEIMQIANTDVVKGVWEYRKNGKVLAYAVNTVTTGYNPDVNIMVGIDVTQKVKGVKIVSFKETKGRGSLADDKTFLEQYVKKELGITVKRSGTPDSTEVVAISGATMTTQAITDGVNAALAEVKTIIERETPQQQETAPEAEQQEISTEGEVLPDEIEEDME